MLSLFRCVTLNLDSCVKVCDYQLQAIKALLIIMEDYDGFPTQFKSLMENVLQTAVGETTKLFERTLRQMRAELVHLSKENADLKSTGFFRQCDGKNTENGTASSSISRSDVGVQCEKPIMVERCCSPAPLGDRSPHLRDITNNHLEDLCSSASGDGNRQLALLLIKKEPQETDCDNSYAPGYFLLKQEGAEPILVRKEPFKDTVERVPISSTFKTVSSCFGNARKKPTTNTASSENSVCLNWNVDSSEKVSQPTSMSKAGLAAPNGTDRQIHQLTSVKNSALSDLPTNLTPSSLPGHKTSAQRGSHSRKQCQLLTPGLQQTTARMNPHTNQTAVPLAAQSQHHQNIQHPAAVAHAGSHMVQPSLSLHQNQITDLCSSIQPFQTSIASSDKRVSLGPVDQSVTPLPPSSIQCSLNPISPSPTVIPPVQNVASLGHCLAAQAHNPVHTEQHTITSGPVPVPPSHVPNRVHQSCPPVHAPVPTTHVQPSEILPSHSQGLNLQAHFAAVPHHSLPSSAQPPYAPSHIPFAPPSFPLQAMKSSASQVSIPQTKASSPLERLPVPTSHYQIMPDPLCSTADQFFPSPDHSSDLLPSLPPMPFHAPILLTQQEAALEQPSMIQSQLSEPPLQLAPLLTSKELQAAASNQVAVRRTLVATDIPISTVNNFEEHVQGFPSCSSPSINSEDTETIIGLQDEDPTETNENSSAAPLPGIGEHFRVLAKPTSNFSLSDSTQEQQGFRMDMIKDLQINSDAHVQKQGPDMTGQVWKSTDTSCDLPFSALSAPASNKGGTLQKVPRRVLEKKTECSECGRVLSNASSLENHMRLHRGERPYTCSQCGKAFPSVRGLNRHVKVHAEEKGYKCEECGRSFVYQFTLTKHKLIHSGDRPFPCKVCGKKFLAKADRATHMRMHTGEKPFFCSQCGKTFKHRVALNMHMQGHRGEKRYVCPHCEKGFVDLGNFKRHKRIHTGEKPFECKQCGKRFTQSAHLKKHVNTQHVEPKTK